jgi:TPR repeat protein
MTLDALFERIEIKLRNNENNQITIDGSPLIGPLIPKLQRQAVDGDRDAQFEMGALCLEGVGVRQDFGEALRWFTMAGGPDQPLTHLAYGRFCQRRRQMDASHSGAREKAMEALGKIGPGAESAIPLLQPELDREWMTGAAAAKALGQIGGRGITILMESLVSKDVGLRRMVALGLYEAGEHARAATLQLTAALEDEDERVRFNAQRALSRLERLEKMP